MKKVKNILFSLILLSLNILNPLFADDEDLPPLPQGPLLLTSVTQEQFSPDYWINRLPQPDHVLKNPQELREFNESIHLEIKERVDIFKMERTRPGRPIRKQLALEYNTLKKRVLFGVDDEVIPKTLFEQEIGPLVQWKNVPNKIEMKWGAVIKATAVRALPSDVKMLEKIKDVEFDQLQFTLIKLWTPVGIFYESTDGRWLYVQAPYSRGWVKAKDIAVFPSRNMLKRYVKSDSFLVAAGESVPIFRDPALTEIFQSVTMGTILPLAQDQKTEDLEFRSYQNLKPVNAVKKSIQPEANYSIWIPVRNSYGEVLIQKAYVDLKSDVTKGFLPYTQRNIIRQAFKLLGARYGWGGMYNGRDCSGFTHDVFLSMGVDMPRGSKEQAFVGTQINHFEPYKDAEGKIQAIRWATPGVGLFRMPHHQMIYLGEVAGRFYVIHSTWAERTSMTSDEKNRINQVVVSDLSLNGESYLGSLFDRIISVSEVN